MKDCRIFIRVEISKNKQVPVGTTMRPGRRLMEAEEKEEVAVVDSIDGPHEAWGCVIY